MADIRELAARFHGLFAGLERAHGTYNDVTQQRDDGKLTGKAVTLVAPVTDELWALHLSGKNGLGIVPIREDATVRFGAIDIDVYADLDPAAIAAKLKRQELPLIPCRSKSGGVHVYLFTSVPVAAGLMQTKLREIAAMLGHGGCEIFPKQSKLAENDFGCWINMPYFDGEQTMRYAVRPDGEAFSMEEFLTQAEQLAVTADFFTGKSSKADAPKDALPDGPPCLNHLVQLGFPPGTRNAGLFNIGIYFRKSRPVDWVDAIEGANQKMLGEPLPSGEVTDIIGSLGKKDYQYGCSKHPLTPYCDAVKCRSRKYGVGGGASSFPTLGQLRKLQTNPPVWFWDVTIDGDVKTVELTTEQLQDPNAFQRKCLEILNIMPAVPTRVHWQQVVQNTLLNNFQPVYAPEDASAEGQVWELIERFCTSNEGISRDDILRGLPWTDNKRTHFRLSDVMRYLSSQQFKEYKVQQLAKVLKMNKNAQHDRVNIKGKFVNLWSLPEFAKQTEGFEVPESISKDETPF